MGLGEERGNVFCADIEHFGLVTVAAVEGGELDGAVGALLHSGVTTIR